MGAQVIQRDHRAKRRIIIVQPHFKTGGAETVAAWAIQAIKALAPVSVLTFDTITPDELNRRFGTYLRAGDFEVLKCSFPFQGQGTTRKFTLLQLHWLMHQCRGWPDKEALLFSTSSEMDFGRPGIQYIDFPQFAEHAVHGLGFFPPQQWYHRPSWLRAMYLRAGRMLSGFSEDGVKANLTLTVSNWTGEIVRKVYGIAARTVYPPVTLEFPPVPFSEREWGFVCVGRIVPSKRILELMRIVSTVRQQGYDVHLHIVGRAGEPGYMREVLAAARAMGSWVSIENSLDRAGLAKMIAQHRFGIHGMLNEHFGIAVAEMAKAGCIVFVPNCGGQVEIVDGDDRVLYSSEAEAIEKITRLLASEEEQVSLSELMTARGMRFSPQAFMAGIRDAVSELL